ncbi:MAG: FAD-dependent oxidoreductase, partial [Pseudomonadota bacterium]
MKTQIPLTRDLLFIGGGHAHALVLRLWGMDPLPGVRITLINPGPTAPYSGMLPGHVAGHYTRDELDIDLVRVARFAGARLIDGAVDGIDLDAKTVSVPGRDPIPWDVASIDIGIHSEMPDLPGFSQHAIGAKPLDRFASEWRSYRKAANAGEIAKEIAIIGGGIAGVELSMAMAHAVPGARVSVLDKADDITGTAAPARLHRAMSDHGVTFHGGVEIDRIEADQIVLDTGQTIPATFTIGAAGARPHPWVAKTKLPLEDGFIRVCPDLSVEGRDDLFGAGDCVLMTETPRPKAGVYAVRSAPILHANLHAALSGKPTKPFKPQGKYLKLISLGGKDALAERGDNALSHPLLWRWKDHIDRKFMRQLTDLRPMDPGPPPRDVAQGVGDEIDHTKPLCAGCGSKVSGTALASALADLPQTGRND